MSKQSMSPRAWVSQSCKIRLPQPGGMMDANVFARVAKAEDMQKHTSCRLYFQGRLGMPLSWFTEYSRKSNGYFGSEILTDEKKGSVTGVSMSNPRVPNSA